MQNKLIKLVAKSARHSKNQIVGAVRPASYLKDLSQQQVGKGKTVLITGASSGLGEGMARLFASLGYNLAICARRTDRLEHLKSEMMDKYPDIRVEYQALDVSDYDTVFQVFDAFADDFGSIERVVVNAGIGDSRRIGKGHFETNRRTADVNFVAALAQCEAAMNIFRAQNSGHLVVISSMSAMRGLPRHLTTYGASKAGLAHLAEGIRADMLLTNLPIKVSTIYPGYIRTEINEGSKPLPFEVDTDTGTKAIVAAIEAGVDEACVPSLPWSMVSHAMKHLPLQVMNKLS
ncbi:MULTISPECIES: SDR family oxidoreductase [Psychrobacter]|uniref:SDR family oxidoreductase n=1 Tax=Psychrobacter TaxID=497 RepID=UPI000A3DD795|nr:MULTISPECIES: SDR family oxidoreductase [Psychrobacter]MBA6245296.1 SDR family oxidoreductase [Psychrobacter sp. Urea-trap-18]MBA6285697.1 SDR family oxidoreductase [Psychrobacter sp. Urea-trap-16]MBA6318944.1 SDR family oxidoreductase [Psychrobacter sp. Urea-trap-20]MBA6333915.1 SDR family oxidoreductase [Psychrobacter sp. Urea-trap-19]PKG61477.1 short chain dehydrogenase [Psychrobacter sp. Choline-3u-12]|tara:strand:+ start:29041 stop:29910 length:870 start_codon:yes stop_codon:yes gene_type:complete